MGLFSAGLLIGRILASEMWGAYFQEGLIFYLLLIFFFLGGGGGYYRNHGISYFVKAFVILRMDQGYVPLVESKKEFSVTDFSDLRFSMEREIQKRIYNHKNTRYHSLINEGKETGNNVIC